MFDVSYFSGSPGVVVDNFFANWSEVVRSTPADLCRDLGACCVGALSGQSVSYNLDSVFITFEFVNLVFQILFGQTGKFDSSRIAVVRTTEVAPINPHRCHTVSKVVGVGECTSTVYLTCFVWFVKYLYCLQKLLKQSKKLLSEPLFLLLLQLMRIMIRTRFV